MISNMPHIILSIDGWTIDTRFKGETQINAKNKIIGEYKMILHPILRIILLMSTLSRAIMSDGYHNKKLGNK